MKTLKNDEKPHIFLQNSMQTLGLYATEAHDGQKNPRENMEVDGQSRKIMPKQTNESEEQSTVHS